ncbi:oxidation resistance protein 1-like isoform X1 [Limulus polyphemus]|uniref:Oxidation resistance protein 1 n=1 Tax=Limulus polyphemus TaxID=6850 RepID=A0ABM1TN66_LIMPO|nr:oxidation resistance protein 1-like isoform X1 [Limulus polyphemus]
MSGQRSLSEKLQEIKLSLQSKSHSLDSINPLQTNIYSSTDLSLKPDWQNGVSLSVLSSSVPLTPVLRYKSPGTLDDKEQSFSNKSALEKRNIYKNETQPPDTFKYTVGGQDTLTSIAARFDTTPSELTKINRLTSRLIFSGQILYIPKKTDENGKNFISVEEKGLEPSNTEGKCATEFVAKSSPKPGHVKRMKSPTDETETSTAETTSVVDKDRKVADFDNSRPSTSVDTNDLDKECLEKFLKIDARYITDGEGVVSGILLVTPNALMFEPNVSDPLVLEHGAEKFSVIAPMEMVFRESVYCDISHMKLKCDPQWSQFLPKAPLYHSKGPQGPETCTRKSKLSRDLDTVGIGVKEVEGEMTETTDVLNVTKSNIERGNLVAQATKNVPECTVFKDFKQELDKSVPITPFKSSFIERKRSGSVDSYQHLKNFEEPGSFIELFKEPNKKNSFYDVESKAVTDNLLKQDDINDGSAASALIKGDKHVSTIYRPPQPCFKTESRKENFMRRFSYPLRSLSSYTKSVSNFVFSSIEDINNFSHGLFNNETKLKDASTLSPVESVSVEGKDGEISVRVEDDQVTDNQCQQRLNIPVVDYKNMVEDKPELFCSIDQLVPCKVKPPDAFPLYLCLKMGWPCNRKTNQSLSLILHEKKRIRSEYWFSIPQKRVDDLYRFFQHWTPEKYGDASKPEDFGFDPINSDEEDFQEEVDSKAKGKRQPRILSLLRLVSRQYSSELSPSDWEIVSMSNLESSPYLDPFELPFPELREESEILTEEHCRELAKHLPHRVEGCPWILIYSSFKHGFSLKTLYREMAKFETPVILAVIDSEGTVFGALTSCSLKISEHFYGTGESFLFRFSPSFQHYYWTEKNTYFIKGDKDSLAFGAGSGQFGLWLDGDLFHGRSHNCETFENDTLSTHEDFVVKGIEAWGFEDN